MIKHGDVVRVVRGWEHEIRDGHYKSRIGHIGRVTGLITDDHGATVQDPALIVDHNIGMVWQEEVELVTRNLHDECHYDE